MYELNKKYCFKKKYINWYYIGFFWCLYKNYIER